MLPLYTAKPVFLFYRIFGKYAVFHFLFLSTIRHTFASERSNKFKLNSCEHATQSTVMPIFFPQTIFAFKFAKLCLFTRAIDMYLTKLGDEITESFSENENHIIFGHLSN